MNVTDEDILREVSLELGWDSRLASSEIAATVKNGVVMLVGTAANFAAKLAAEEAAHRVPAVRDVANEVRVVNSPGRSDNEIAHAVRQALEWDALVDHEQIHSTVSNHWVTLTGTVHLLREREDAERAIRHLAGVRGVTNAIEIAGPRVEPGKIRRAIEEALERRAQRGAKHVHVKVENSAVTLFGKVDSWLEKRAVLGIVGHLPGVRSVHDGLEVDAYTT